MACRWNVSWVVTDLKEWCMSWRYPKRWLYHGFTYIWVILLVNIGKHTIFGGWWFHRFLYFHPENWRNGPIWRSYFSDGWLNHQLVSFWVTFNIGSIFKGVVLMYKTPPSCENCVHCKTMPVAKNNTDKLGSQKVGNVSFYMQYHAMFVSKWFIHHILGVSPTHGASEITICLLFFLGRAPEIDLHGIHC